MKLGIQRYIIEDQVSPILCAHSDTKDMCTYSAILVINAERMVKTQYGRLPVSALDDMTEADRNAVKFKILSHFFPL